MTRRCHQRCAMAAAAALAAAMTGAFAAPAAAQQGPTVFTQQQQHDWLSLTPTRGELGALYRGQRDDNNPGNGSSTHFSEDRFEEALTLQGIGSIYHPNLVYLDMTGTFGLFQDQLDNNGESDNENGTLYEWDLNATLLRKEDIVPTLYSRRTRQVVSRTFGANFEETITQTGVILDIRSKAVPTRIEAYHSDQDQTSPGDQTGDFHLSQDAVVWHSEYRPDTHQVLTWDYTYNNVSQSTGDIHSNFQTSDATLSHSIDFGPKDKNNLSSTLHYFNQTGDFAIQQFHWDELLRLRHTDNFETHYEYTLDQQNSSNVDQTTQRATAGFTHQLYQSLVTNFTLGVEDEQLSGGEDSFQYFANLEFDYQKKVPLGRFTAGLALGWNQEDNSARKTQTQVIDQPRTFGDVQPIVIVAPGIQANSIVVTDPSGLLIYLPGVDYTVTPIPGAVQLDRVIGGRINPGQQVLIDYTLAAQPSNVTTTSYFSLGGRYDIQRGPLRGLGIYARYTRQNQDISSDNPLAFVPNSYTDTLVGGDYTFWLMQVGAEQEWHDSTIIPFDATRFFARLNSPINSAMTLSLNSAYDIIDYKDQDNHVQLWTVSAQLQYRFTRNLFGFATVLWRDEQNQLNGDSTGWEEQLEIQWHHRQTYFYGRLRNSDLSSGFQDNHFQFFEVGVKRQF